MIRSLIVALVLTGCLPGAVAPKPCSNEELVAIQSDYLLAVKASCVKGVPLASCPAYEQIRNTRDSRTTRWITECSQ